VAFPTVVLTRYASFNREEGRSEGGEVTGDEHGTSEFSGEKARLKIPTSFLLERS
jgi:hypothetical protein